MMDMIWRSFTRQNQWKDYIQNLLRTNNTALWRALSIVYNNQTIQERYAGVSNGDNNIGFDRRDGGILSDIEIRSRCGDIDGRDLSILRDRLPKYWRQIMVAIKLPKEFSDVNNVMLLCRDGNAAQCPYKFCSRCIVNTGKQVDMGI